MICTTHNTEMREFPPGEKIGFYSVPENHAIHMCEECNPGLEPVGIYIGGNYIEREKP